MADRLELYKRLCAGAEFNRKQLNQDMETIHVCCSLRHAPMPAYARVHAALSAISVVTSKELRKESAIFIIAHL